MEFEHHLKALVYYHLEERVSAQDLLQELRENDYYARQFIAPPASCMQSIAMKGMAKKSPLKGAENFATKYTQVLNRKLLNLKFL